MTIPVLADGAFSPFFVSQAWLPTASAASVSIQTSADIHGNTFFGHGVLQVVVNDPDADDDDLQESLVVDIQSDSDLGTTASSSFEIFETSDSSGRFEFFLVHAASNFADGVGDTILDPINPNGFAPVGTESPIPNAEASIITFGDGGDLDNGALAVLFSDFVFDITVGDAQITIDYEEAAALVELDRETYGSNSLLYLTIVDQDGNLNPTASDLFIVSDADLLALFTLSGADFDGTTAFEETGDNAARFEAILQLNTTATLTTDELVITSESVQVTLHDMANYNDPGFDNVENDSTDTDDDSFDVDDVDGEISEIGTVTFASELKVSVNDNDQNFDSKNQDTIPDALIVKVDSEGGDSMSVDLNEINDNSGVFVPDQPNDEIRITFVNGPTLDPSQLFDEVLQLRPGDMTEDILVSYVDLRDDNSNPNEFMMRIQPTLVSPTINLPQTADEDEEFLLTIINANLNDNPRSKDVYAFRLGGAGPYPLLRTTEVLSDLASLEVKIEGDPLTFVIPLEYALVEDNVNSGKFVAKLDMADILASARIDGNPVDVGDGDMFEISYNDLFDDVPHKVSDALEIGSGTPVTDFLCQGLVPTMLGTDKDDTLVGTEGKDVIIGLRGNDIIRGLGGDDIICGGPGLDSVYGGEGNDRLFGGRGNDLLLGEAGNDMIWAGTGWDELFGGSGDDLMRAGKGNDSLRGENGDDRLYGEAGNDQLNGGSGNNLLIQDWPN
jgi:hypothetical protein